MLVPEDNDKKTIISLREIGDGKVSVEELEKNAILRLRKEPDESLQLEEKEEEENDEFENLYKGQISKSGIAILPSKRTRKIPEIKHASPEVSTPENKDTDIEKIDDPEANRSPNEDTLTLKEEVTD